MATIMIEILGKIIRKINGAIITIKSRIMDIRTDHTEITIIIAILGNNKLIIMINKDIKTTLSLIISTIKGSHTTETIITDHGIITTVSKVIPNNPRSCRIIPMKS